MPLQFKNIAVGNLQDDVSGNNYAANKAVYILNLNNTLAQIFSDEAGTIPIVQDGVNNVTGARGVFGFWVEAGDYFVQVGANKYRVSITGADYFNNRIDETIDIIVDSVAGRGAYYVVGSFEAGFTYTDINQVGTFGGTDYYVYTGGLTNLPHIVTAGTDPTLSADYQQVTYNSTSNISDPKLGNLESALSSRFVDFASFGATVAGDSTQAISDALNAAKDGNITIVDFSGKTYTYTGNINIQASKLSIFTNVTLQGNGGNIHIYNGFTEIGTITAAQSSGNDTLTLSSVAGLSEGDILVTTIDEDFSFSSHRPEYKEGEFFEVKSITGSIVTSTKPLEADYTGTATNKVYKLNAVDLELRGGTYKSDSAAYALRLSNMSPGSVVAPKEVSTTLHIVGAMSIEKSYGSNVYFGKYQAPYLGAGNDYGINVVNSQDIDMYGIDAFGGRHPVTTGGDNVLPNPPCRRIRVHDSKLANDSAASVYAADFHGNSADCAYINCVTTGAVGLAGKNPRYEGGEVVCHDDSDDIPLSWHELVGGVCIFKDVKVTNKTGTATTISGITAGSLSDNIDGAYRVIIDGLDAEVNSNVTSIVSAYENSSQVNDWELRNFSTRGGLSLLDSAILFTKGGSGRDAESIVVEATEGKVPTGFDWLRTSGTTLNSCQIRIPTANGTNSLTPEHLVDYQGPVETGSNANGSYIKYADGRMEQEHRLSVTDSISAAFLGGFRTGSITWTFPEPFVAGSQPAITAVPEDASMFSVVESAKTNTDVALLGTAITSQASATRNLSVTAVGRWK